jgi:hypothetical protein
MPLDLCPHGTQRPTGLHSPPILVAPALPAQVSPHPGCYTYFHRAHTVKPMCNRYILFSFSSWCPLRRSRLNTPCNPSSSSSNRYTDLDVTLREHRPFSEPMTGSSQQLIAPGMQSVARSKQRHPHRTGAMQPHYRHHAVMVVLFLLPN